MTSIGIDYDIVPEYSGGHARATQSKNGGSHSKTTPVVVTAKRVYNAPPMPHPPLSRAYGGEQIVPREKPMERNG
jgi:hypothetical protein